MSDTMLMDESLPEPEEPDERRPYDGDDEPAYVEAHAVAGDVLAHYEALEVEQLAEVSLVGQIVTRREWRAAPPKRPIALRNPRGSTAHWHGPRLGSFPHSSCAVKVRGIQRDHMDQKGWDDIAYTSIVCPHGAIFQCRWWGVRTAANGTNAGNAASYAHCVLIGQGDPFPEAARQGLRAAFQLARQQGGAGPERWCHFNWKPTACPGPAICDFVKAGM